MRLHHLWTQSVYKLLTLTFYLLQLLITTLNSYQPSVFHELFSPWYNVHLCGWQSVMEWAIYLLTLHSLYLCDRPFIYLYTGHVTSTASSHWTRITVQYEPWNLKPLQITHPMCLFKCVTKESQITLIWKVKKKKEKRKRKKDNPPPPHATKTSKFMQE